VKYLGELLRPALGRHGLQLGLCGEAPGGGQIVALECHPACRVLADGIGR
jgi:hypothetical protein